MTSFHPTTNSFQTNEAWDDESMISGAAGDLERGSGTRRATRADDVQSYVHQLSSAHISAL